MVSLPLPIAHLENLGFCFVFISAMLSSVSMETKSQKQNASDKGTVQVPF